MKLNIFTPFLFIALFGYTQEGIVSGTLNDESGLPLPGVSIIVKGTTTGVETDFDGNYSIPCKVGDILLFNYIGYVTREVVVTNNMFSTNAVESVTPKHAVTPIKTTIYNTLIHQESQDSLFSNTLKNMLVSNSKTNNYYKLNKLKSVKIKNDTITLKYYKKPWFFNIELNQTSGVRFVQKTNLYKTQKTYSQGRPFNGVNAWFGPETNEIFSFGPNINTLYFDSNNYAFDNNGALTTNPSNLKSRAYNNAILQDIFVSKTTFNTAFFNTNNEVNFLYTNTTNRNLFNTALNKNSNLSLSYKEKHNNPLKVNLNYFSNKDNLTNINGFQNIILLNNYVTPATFSNLQGIQLNNQQQRSFNALNNNPLWLLQKHKNKNTNTVFLGKLSKPFSLNDELLLKPVLTFNTQNNKQHFGLPINTVGFETGYISNKSLKSNTLNIGNYLFFEPYLYGNIDLDFETFINYKHENFNYNLSEFEAFTSLTFENPQTASHNNNNLNRSNFEFINKLVLDYRNDIFLTLKNHSFSTNKHKSSWFNPSIQLSIIPTDLFYNLRSDFLDYLNVVVGYSSIHKQPTLFYNNTSHNSLQFLPEDVQQLTTNNDLFLNTNLNLERISLFETEISGEFFNNQLHFGVNYNYLKNYNSIFPVFNNSAYTLQNIAHISKKGWEINASFYTYKYNSNFNLNTEVAFSSYRSNVDKLLTQNTRIPIAGFSTISNNLIQGQQAGVIVGSSYLKDANNNIIIGDDGFPLVNNTQKIIADPNPKFKLTNATTLSLKKWSLSFLLEYQHGGQVWNGTQNVLNYHGVSKETELKRNYTNYIFNGVTTNGNQNTIAVDFANPNTSVYNNRWVRYGYSGVAESAIEDASYFNLSNIALTFKLFEKIKPKKLFKQLKITAYGNNLLTLAKFDGASPYSNLFDSASASGLNFFNTPLVSELGLTLNIQI